MKVKQEETGERRGGGACNHFFRQPVPVYQLLVYPLIGQIWQIISTLSKRVVPVTQKEGMRRPRVWNRGIHDNFCVEPMFTRFPAHRCAEEGIEYLPCELGAWKKCFCNPADGLRSCLIKKVTITEKSKKGVIYGLQTILTLSLDLFRRTSLSFLKSNFDWLTTF